MTFEIGIALPISYTTGVTGSTVAYSVINPSGTVVTSGTLTENSHYTGVYEGSFTPDVAGMWKVVYTVGVNILTQSIPVAFGTLSDPTYGLSAIKTAVNTAASNQAVATTDASTNVLERDAVGAKDDAAVLTVQTTKSLMGYAKGNLTEALAIKAKTDNLPAVPASQGDTATALSNQDLDHVVKVSYGAAKPTDGSLFDQIMNKDGSQTFDSTTDSLEALQNAIALLSGAGVAADTEATYSVTTSNDTVETQIFENAIATNYAFDAYFDFNALTAAAEGGVVTLRVYNKIDGTNYREILYVQFTVGSDAENPSVHFPMLHNYSKVTIQCSTDVSATRSVPYVKLTKAV